MATTQKYNFTLAMEDNEHDQLIANTALRNLSLLGYRSDVYSKDYPHLHCKALDSTSFDKPNDRVLFVTLHFLMGELNEDFLTCIMGSWPYFDTKSKNECKIIIDRYMSRYVNDRIITPDLCRASVFENAKGTVVWRLFWKLSNAVMIKQLSKKGSLPPPSDNLSILRDMIEMKYRDLIESNLRVVQRQREQFKYAEELAVRLRNSRRNIDSIQHSLEAIEDTGTESGRILTPSGRIDRTQMLLRIDTAIPLLARVKDSRAFDRLVDIMKYSSQPDINIRNSQRFGATLDELINRHGTIDDEDEDDSDADTKHNLNDYLDQITGKLKKLKEINGFKTGTGLSDPQQLRELHDSATIVEAIRINLDKISSDITILDAKYGGRLAK